MLALLFGGMYVFKGCEEGYLFRFHLQVFELAGLKRLKTLDAASQTFFETVSSRRQGHQMHKQEITESGSTKPSLLINRRTL